MCLSCKLGVNKVQMQGKKKWTMHVHHLTFMFVVNFFFFQRWSQSLNRRDKDEFDELFYFILSSVMLPRFAAIAYTNNNTTHEKRRSTIAMALFSAYSALSCCCILYLQTSLSSSKMFLKLYAIYFVASYVVCHGRVLKRTKVKFWWSQRSVGSNPGENYFNLCKT